LSSLLKIPVSVLFILFSLSASAGDPYRTTAGAGEAGTGYTCITKEGFWSSFHNPSLLGYNKSLATGFNYENRFGISELGSRTAGLIVPAVKTSIGVLYSHFGYSDFSRDMIAVASGMKLSEKIAAGVQIDYFSQHASGGYETNRVVTFEAGLIFSTGDNTRIGIHLFNPLPNSIRKNFLPSVLTVGAGTLLGEQVYAGIEAEMSNMGKPLFRTGFEYNTNKNIWLRGGYCTDNNSFSFGLGYLLKFMKLDLAFVTHDKLGVSTSCSIIIYLKKEEIH
jgi:hypothetical protein